MARQSRESVQDAALVQLLRALPLERLDGILETIGVQPADRDAVQRKVDPRHCRVCGQGYVRCRAADSHAPEGEGHEWTPDRSRSDA